MPFSGGLPAAKAGRNRQAEYSFSSSICRMRHNRHSYRSWLGAVGTPLAGQQKHMPKIACFALPNSTPTARGNTYAIEKW